MRAAVLMLIAMVAPASAQSDPGLAPPASVISEPEPAAPAQSDPESAVPAPVQSDPALAARDYETCVLDRAGADSLLDGSISVIVATAREACAEPRAKAKEAFLARYEAEGSDASRATMFADDLLESIEGGVTMKAMGLVAERRARRR